MEEIVALGLGVVLGGDALLPLSRLRIIAIMAGLFISATDVATIFLNGDLKLAFVRSAAGLGEGALVWVTTCMIVRSRAPDRMAAIFLVMQTLAQSAAAAMLAGIIVPRAGWHGGFVALAAISLLPCVIAVWLPARVPPLAAQSFDKFRWSITAALSYLQPSPCCRWRRLEPYGLLVPRNVFPRISSVDQLHSKRANSSANST